MGCGASTHSDHEAAVALQQPPGEAANAAWREQLRHHINDVPLPEPQDEVDGDAHGTDSSSLIGRLDELVARLLFEEELRQLAIFSAAPPPPRKVAVGLSVTEIDSMTSKLRLMTPPGDVTPGCDSSPLHLCTDLNFIQSNKRHISSPTSPSKRALTARVSADVLSTNQECILCLENFSSGEDIRVLRCAHYFHASCIDDWLTRSRTCPVCCRDVGASSNGGSPTASCGRCGEADVDNSVTDPAIGSASASPLPAIAASSSASLPASAVVHDDGSPHSLREEWKRGMQDTDGVDRANGRIEDIAAMVSLPSSPLPSLPGAPPQVC